MQQLREAVRRDLRWMRRLIIVGALGLAVLVLAVGRQTDHRSCLRQQPVRHAAALEAEVARSTAAYWSAHSHPEIARLALKRARILGAEHQLDCSALLPGA